ncbi:site-specific integrase [Streptomyces sp. NBC_00201]|uniref:tyrosine-type recombinase/integrase n=1 Tax=unclassified Streptomyces TaxID=2593676 RepID=UPI0022545691|nr:MULTISPECIES: site-specific integrase [unclassified Streptomyces]MCX5055593.1 site-specific integrase [Streptomyces sp. NBC_00452]MCX5248069.1 site-specific integrase [Streptomyces sp. NBC_00201]MCX5286658.1 site-specific integrase [Streptomyces sp. NBC_00183]
MPAVVRLPAGKALTVRAAADVFLDSLDNANTLRSYGIGVGKTAEHLGEARPLATVADDEIGGALEQLWGEAAVNTWNARRAAVLSWLGWCAERGYDGPKVPAWVKRMPPPDSETPARSKMAVDRLIARRDVHLREKTLWRMLYETVARSEEILGVNIEELDLAGRRAPVKAKGAKPRTRRRGVTREDYVLEPVYWDAGTARLLPRLIKGRTRGPVFVTHRKPGPGKVIAPRDVCPDTGLVRLSYGQARALLDAHTAIGGVPGTGWDLHEYRHSGLTHLGEAGASLPMLMAKSRHKKPENVRRYFHPSAEAIAEVTSLLAPGDARR